eukprot:8604471-Pyramimonas_sp.AAC.1
MSMAGMAGLCQKMLEMMWLPTTERPRRLPDRPAPRQLPSAVQRPPRRSAAPCGSETSHAAEPCGQLPSAAQRPLRRSAAPRGQGALHAQGSRSSWQPWRPLGWH